MLIVAASSELAGRDSAPRAPRPRRRAAHRLAQHAATRRRYLRGRVPDLNVVFRTDDNGTLMGLVAEGLGVAVVPRLVVNPRNPALVALPFGTRIPPRDIAIVWHRDRYRSAAAEAFAGLARDMGAEYAATMQLANRPAVRRPVRRDDRPDERRALAPAPTCASRTTRCGCRP